MASTRRKVIVGVMAACIMLVLAYSGWLWIELPVWQKRATERSQQLDAEYDAFQKRRQASLKAEQLIAEIEANEEQLAAEIEAVLKEVEELTELNRSNSSVGPLIWPGLH